MIAKKSALQLRDFVIVQSQFTYHSFNEKEVTGIDDALRIMDQYIIDVDFGFQDAQSKGLYLFTKVAVNFLGTPVAGPSMFVESVCFIEKAVVDVVPKEHRVNELTGPALNYCVNQIRAHMAALTSFSQLENIFFRQLAFLSCSKKRDLSCNRRRRRK